jgi:hypothetical protein
MKMSLTQQLNGEDWMKNFLNERNVYFKGQNVHMSDIGVHGITTKTPFKAMLSRQQNHPLKFAIDAIEQSFVDRTNQYELFNYMNWSDGHLGASIGTKGGLVGNAYRGLTMDAGRELDDQELFLIVAGEKIAEELLGIKVMIPIITENLLTFGNAIYRKAVGKDGYPRLTAFPINYVTILETVKQIYGMGANRDFQVWEPNLYVLNEVMDSRLTNVYSNTMKIRNRDHPLPMVFPQKDIIHIQIRPGHDEVDDAMSRKTFGVWSRSPLQRLQTTWWWKQEIMWADMLAREQTQPLQWHKLDLSWIDDTLVNVPTGDSRLNYVVNARRAYINAYIDAQEKRSPDSNLVTDEHVEEVKIIEPQAVTYLAANELIKQLDETHTRALGLPISESGSASGSYGTDVNRMAHSSVTTDHLINVVFGHLELYIRELLLQYFPANSKQIMRIKISRGMSLDKDKDMMMRRAAVAKELNIFTEDELREIAGEQRKLTPMEKKERDSFYERIASYGKDFGMEGAGGGKAIGSNASTKKISSQSAGREPAKKQPPQGNRPVSDRSKLQRQKTT